MATATREFQVLAKPIGAVCNLDCRYCYYLAKKDLYPQPGSFRMADGLLESYIAQHIQACPKETVLFSWHGGEPTVLGIDYFRRIVELQRKYRPPGREIINGIQTNGTLIDEAWCRFLAEEHFYVGLSVDGPHELHDRYRVTKSQKATHKQVMQAFRLLQRHRVSTDVLCVVHQHNVRHPTAVYRFFRDLGVEYLQFLPLVQRRGEGVSAETVPPEAYGTFLCTVFNEWVRNDIERIGIQNFEEASRPFLGIPHALCIFRETCGDIVVLEHNGDVYECDHFVTSEHRLGNVRETPLLTLLESSRLRAFGARKHNTLPRHCRECAVLYQCHGGCPKDCLARAPDGEEGVNHLCAGFKRFFTHCGPYLQRMAQARHSGVPMAAFMSALRRRTRKQRLKPAATIPVPAGAARSTRSAVWRIEKRLRLRVCS